jgi:hypothetical protein
MPSLNPITIINDDDVDTVDSVIAESIETIYDIDIISKMEEIGLESTLELVRIITLNAADRITTVLINNIVAGIITESNAVTGNLIVFDKNY